MSRENVERMRRSFEIFDRGDRSTWLAMRVPEYEVIAAGVWPDADVVRGPEAAWDFYIGVADTFEGFVTRVAKVEEAGENAVLVDFQTELRGKASGADVDFRYWSVVTFCEGKILRDQWFTDRAAALEAVRLSE